MKNKFYGMLGICAKAGAVASGAFAAEKAIKDGKAFFVIVANDASESTKSGYEKMCFGYNVPLKVYGNRCDLGRAIGKDERTIIAITDEGLSKNLQKKIVLEE